MSDCFYELHTEKELCEVKSFLLEHIHHLGEGLFSKYFPELYNDIFKISFPFEIKKFSQKLYHVLNMDVGKWELGLCKICGKRCSFKNFSIGYSSYCCCKCAGSDPEVNKKNRETNIRLHGEDYAEKRSRKGIETKSKFSKEKLIEINKKRKNTKFEKYGDENYNNSKKQQKTMLEKYGGVGFSSKHIMEKYTKTMEDKYGDVNYRNKERGIDTIKKLHRIWKENFNDSSPLVSSNEIKIYDFLLERFGNDDVFPQYKSDLYPFFCDFYIKSIDLYIEINGHPTHGKHPFNQGDENDISFLNRIKKKNTPFYNKFIEVWTERDVLKRKTAFENGLNLLEIFSNDFFECKNIINNHINKNLICQKLVH